MQPRILEVLERVTRCGPITLDQISQKTGISRSATFRALKILQEKGWIRLRLDGRRYVATCQVEERLAPKIEPRREIDDLIPVISSLIDARQIRVRVLQQETNESMEIVDDSLIGTTEFEDHSEVMKRSVFLLKVLQLHGFATGKAKFNSRDTTQADIVIKSFKNQGFAIVDGDYFLWIPMLSENGVIMICLSLRDFSQFTVDFGTKLSKALWRKIECGRLSSFKMLN